MTFLAEKRCLRPGGAELTRHALTLCSLPVGSLVADVGSGMGLTVSILQDLGYRALGVDISPKANGLPQVAGAAENLPLKDEVLDGVVCECALCLAKEQASVLEELARVTRKGGTLLLSDLYLRKPAKQDGSQVVDLSDMKARLEHAGWELCHFEDHSRSLIILAAQLCWHGQAKVLPWDQCGYHDVPIPWKSCGYGLWIGKKE